MNDVILYKLDKIKNDVIAQEKVRKILYNEGIEEDRYFNKRAFTANINKVLDILDEVEEVIQDDVRIMENEIMRNRVETK